MNVLLTGASSLLGWELLRQAPRDWQITACVHSNPDLPEGVAVKEILKVDLTKEISVQRAVAECRPDAIIHMGSNGNLEYCKDHPDEAVAVNVDGTRNIIEASRPFDSQVVFTSTMYVFDGRTPPYTESAQTNPVNHYGVTKLEAERRVLQLGERAAILRPTTMYGWHSPRQRANWVTWLLKRLADRAQVPVVTDVFSNQIWVGDAAASIIAAVQKRAHGIFHLGGSETVSRYDFSVDVALAFGYSPEHLIPVPSSYFPQLAQRPGSAVCSVERMRNVLGIEPLRNREGLEQMRLSAPRALGKAAAAEAGSGRDESARI